VILVRRRLMFTLLVSCLAAVLYLAIRGYLEASRMSLPAQAETTLFLGIVFCLLILLLFAALLLKSFNVSRELDKQISLAQVGSVSVGESLRRLGPLGGKIRLLQAGVQELSQRRSLRISSLSGILDFLLNNTEVPLLVLDLAGGIEAVSRGFLERNKKQAGEVVGRHIAEVDPEVPFPEVVARMEREHAPAGQPGKESLVYYPVYNGQSQLANLIAVQGPGELRLVRAEAAEARPGGYARLLGLIRRYAQRRPRESQPPTPHQG
jgi:PAS domain-containing protein